MLRVHHRQTRESCLHSNLSDCWKLDGHCRRRDGVRGHRDACHDEEQPEVLRPRSSARLEYDSLPRFALFLLTHMRAHAHSEPGVTSAEAVPKSRAVPKPQGKPAAPAHPHNTRQAERSTTAIVCGGCGIAMVGRTNHCCLTCAAPLHGPSSTSPKPTPHSATTGSARMASRQQRCRAANDY